MKKILFLATNFYPYRGGLENYLLQLAERLVKKGFQVDVLTYRINTPEYEEYNGINIYRIPCYNIMKDVYSLPRLWNKDTKKILKQLRANNYDFVITQTRFFSTSWLGMRFARKNKISYVHTEHGNVHVKHNNKLIELAAWLYDMTIGKKIFKRAGKVIGISQACCNFSIIMGADPKKVHLIYNSIDTKVFKPGNKEKARKDLELNPEKFIISYAGRLIYAKGLHDLIQACAGIEDLQLVVMGKGPYEEELKKLSRKLDVDINWTGVIEPDQVLKYTIASDLSVNPSYSEGLPTCVLEPSACGIPVIATDVGGTNEIIEHGKTGYLFEPKDINILRKYMIDLKDNKHLRDRMGKKAVEKVKQSFDWDRNVDRYIKEILD